MTDEKDLIEKLQRVEALFARAGTAGEKTAAAGAAERIRRRLEEIAEQDPPVEHRFTIHEGWSRKLFIALLRRYGVSPYRYRGQRRTTLMARASRRFVQETLWPEFEEFRRILDAHVSEVTERIIARAVSPDFREGEEIRAENDNQIEGPDLSLPSPA